MSYMHSYRRRQRVRKVVALVGILATGTLAAWLNASLLLPQMGLKVPEIHFWALTLLVVTASSVAIKEIQTWGNK